MLYFISLHPFLLRPIFYFKMDVQGTYTVKNGSFIMRSGFYVYEFKLTYKRDHESHIESHIKSHKIFGKNYLTDYAIKISTKVI